MVFDLRNGFLLCYSAICDEVCKRAGVVMCGVSGNAGLKLGLIA